MLMEATRATRWTIVGTWVAVFAVIGIVLAASTLRRSPTPVEGTLITPSGKEAVSSGCVAVGPRLSRLRAFNPGLLILVISVLGHGFVVAGCLPFTVSVSA